MDKNELLARLRPEIEHVDLAMQNDLQDLRSDGTISSSLAEVLDHALFNGGKRIRPLLCILAARLCGNASREIYPLAIGFEYLHVATLLHDDVIDHADTRRGRPAVNTVFGLTPAILGGDFLHARSMHLIGTLGGRQCLELICNATEAMVTGEFLQLANARNFNQSEDDYFAVINGKTALFIGAVCQTGGIYAGADDRMIETLGAYGANLGKAFQIQDDLLDYLGDPAKTGKAVGNDFCEGKMTLPLIHALKNSDKTNSIFLLDLLRGEKNSRKAQFDKARDIIAQSGGFEYGRRLAAELMNTGLSGLDSLRSGENGETLTTLTGLAHYIISRDK